MRSIKGFVTSFGMVTVAAVAMTGCLTEDGTLEEQGVGEEQSELAQVGRKGAHCVVETVAQGKGEPRPANLSAAPARCFDTFSDAIFAATEGRVRLPPSVTPKTVDEQMLHGGAASASLASYVIGIEYQDPFFGGASLTFTSPVTCYGYDHSVNLTGLPGWDNTISSSQAFSSCNNSYHFEYAFSGYYVNCGTGCSYIGGVMSERTSSLLWTY